jgi:hypothetical protein
VRKKKRRKKQSCEKVEKPKTLIKFTKQYQIIKICIQNVTGVFFFFYLPPKLTLESRLWKQLFKSNLTFYEIFYAVWKITVFLRRVVHQLFKSNLIFCIICVFNRQFEKSVFLTRVVHSQSILQRHLWRQIKKNTLIFTLHFESGIFTKAYNT